MIKSVQKLSKFIKKIPRELMGLLLIGSGLILTLFSMWQLNLMTADYATSVWDTPFSINVELFPNMTFGVAYDLSMIINLLSWFPTIIGTYLLYRKIKYLKSELKRWIQLIGGEEYYE